MAYAPGRTISTVTPQEVAKQRLLSIHAALQNQKNGVPIKGKMKIASLIVRQEFGFKGNLDSVINQYEQMLREDGILPSL